MSKKILVIEDRGEFRKKLNVATIQSVCVVADVERLLKDYEQDVIGFKAKVKAKNLGAGYTAGPHRIEIPQNIKLKLGEYYQVFVLKPKKPEVKHERDKT